MKTVPIEYWCQFQKCGALFLLPSPAVGKVAEGRMRGDERLLIAAFQKENSLGIEYTSAQRTGGLRLLSEDFGEDGGEVLCELL